MSARLDQARRLELTDVQDVGDFVGGRARGLAISLEGEAPFTACTIELGVAIPIARMKMVAGDLNHPDAVETGDGEFDERMQVTSLPTYAPTLQQLLAAPKLRAALLKFFAKYPDAEFIGTKLRVPAGEEGVSQRLIVDALEVAELMVARFTEIGFLAAESRTVLPEDVREPRYRSILRVVIVVAMLLSVPTALLRDEPTWIFVGLVLLLIAPLLKLWEVDD